MKPIRHVTDANLIAVANLIGAMRKGATANEMAEASGFTVITCNRYAAALHQVGEAHIERLLPDSRGLYKTRVWKLGPGVDAKQPPARSRTERQRQYRRRLRLEVKGPENVLQVIATSLSQGTENETDQHQGAQPVGGAQSHRQSLRHGQPQEGGNGGAGPHLLASAWGKRP